MFYAVFTSLLYNTIFEIIKLPCMSSIMVLSHMDTVIIHVPVIPNTKATKCQTLNAQSVIK